MKNKFVRVFDCDEHQLLLMKTENNEGEPRLELITEHEGIRAKIGLDFDICEMRDKAFDEYTSTGAAITVANIIKQFN